jgi:hypothetical protein
MAPYVLTSSRFFASLTLPQTPFQSHQSLGQALGPHIGTPFFCNKPTPPDPLQVFSSRMVVLPKASLIRPCSQSRLPNHHPL